MSKRLKISFVLLLIFAAILASGCTSGVTAPSSGCVPYDKIIYEYSDLAPDSVAVELCLR